MKRESGGGLVEVETGYEKAVSRKRLSVERNSSLIEVTVPIGVIRSLANTQPLPMKRSARGSALMPAQPAPPPALRRVEVALMTAIVLVLSASTIVAAL